MKPYWISYDKSVDIKEMARVLKISYVMAKILANRGIATKNQAIKHLRPIEQYMGDPSQMADFDIACEIIEKGVKEQKRFCIYGDYDVDGVTSCVIVYKAIAAMGGIVDYYIPHRINEGYGLNNAAIEAIADKADILIAVDNGIAAYNEVKYAKELDLCVIIVDHHEPPTITDEYDEQKEQLPPADAIIDPKRGDCRYPFKGFSAAGLCYLLARALSARAGREFKERDEFMILAAISTFCDVVDLVSENRIIATQGLFLLCNEKNTNVGLNALVKCRNLGYNEINAHALGFIIGPCINAAGRLDDAGLAVDLLLCNDEAAADTMARRLAELNEERKALCTQFVEAAISPLENIELPSVICLYIPNMHESIAGIVAGRIKDRLYRPTLVFTEGEGGLIKGSARSIEGYNVFEEMQACKELFVRFGGHAMAAGASMTHSNLDELKQRLNAACKLEEHDFVPYLRIDDELELDDISFDFAKSLERLGPFGKANKKPTFASYQIHTTGIECIGKNKTTLRMGFTTNSGRKISGICFNKLDQFMDMLKEAYSPAVCEAFIAGRMRDLVVKLDIAYNVEINYFNNNASIQLNIQDFNF